MSLNEELRMIGYSTLSIPEAGETAEAPVKRYCCSGFGFLSGRLGLIDWFASLYPIGCRHL